MNYHDAMHIAENVARELSDCCQRIEIAGSLRRGKNEVKDIEIVGVPKMTMDLFGESIPDEYDIYGKLAGMNAIFEKNGSRYKKVMLPQGISLDLFLVWKPAQWGVIYTIRTGPADFSRWVVTQQFMGGALPGTSYVRDGSVWADGTRVWDEDNEKWLWIGGEMVTMPEEIDFLDYCKLGWIEPEHRRANWRQ